MQRIIEINNMLNRIPTRYTIDYFLILTISYCNIICYKLSVILL